MMNRWMGALTVLVGGLAGANAFGQGERIRDDRAEARELGWVFNYDEARRLARQSKRPMMIVFRCVP